MSICHIYITYISHKCISTLLFLFSSPPPPTRWALRRPATISQQEWGAGIKLHLPPLLDIIKLYHIVYIISIKVLSYIFKYRLYISSPNRMGSLYEIALIPFLLSYIIICIVIILIFADVLKSRFHILNIK